MRRLLAILILPFTILLMAMPASAGSPSGQSFHGTFTSATVCGTQLDIKGTWNVTLRNDGNAVVDVAVFEKDAATGEYVPHAFWGGHEFGAWFTGGATAKGFSVSLGEMSFRLAGQDLTYRIDPYPYCEAGPRVAVLRGTLTN